MDTLMKNTRRRTFRSPAPGCCFVICLQRCVLAFGAAGAVADALGVVGLAVEDKFLRVDVKGGAVEDGVLLVEGDGANAFGGLAEHVDLLERETERKLLLREDDDLLFAGVEFRAGERHKPYKGVIVLKLGGGDDGTVCEEFGARNAFDPAVLCEEEKHRVVELFRGHKENRSLLINLCEHLQ